MLSRVSSLTHDQHGLLRRNVQHDLKPLGCRRRDKMLRYLVELGIGRFERMLARGVPSPEPGLADLITDVEVVKPVSHAGAVK